MQRRKTKRNNIFIVVGTLLIFFATSYLIFNYYSNERLKQQDNDKVEEFFEVEEEEIEEVVEEVVEEPKEEKQQINYDYIAVLEIPKINLKRGLVSTDSKYNNVNYNIKIVDGSLMPYVRNGNLILAGHNGSAYISFFKNLCKLDINDSVYVYFDGIKYEYKIADIYDVDKTGTVNISRDKNRTTITLITCKKYSKDKQTVFIGYLSNKEAY